MDLLQRRAEPAITGNTASGGFHITQERFGAGDRVMHALPGNAFLLGDLAEGEILIIIEIKIGFLLFRQKAAVVIQQQGHGERFLLHRARLLLTACLFYNNSARLSREKT